MFEELQPALITLCVTILSGAIAVVGAYVTLYLRKIMVKLQAETNKITNDVEKQLAQDSLARINELIFQSVLATQVTIVEGLKNASEDGKLNKEDAEKIAESVKKQVLEQLAPDVVSSVKTQINDLDAYINSRIEVELTKVKKELK